MCHEICEILLFKENIARFLVFECIEVLMISRSVRERYDDFFDVECIEFRKGRGTSSRDGDIGSFEDGFLVFFVEPIEYL